MLRVVADANVLISAALARSPNAPFVLILDAALDSRLELITSPMLLREIASVLARPRLRKYLTTDEALRFVADLAGQTTLLADSRPHTRPSAATPRMTISLRSRSRSSPHASSSTASADQPTHTIIRSPGGPATYHYAAACDRLGITSDCR